MSLSKSKLATQLQNLVPVASEATAINTLAAAYTAYASQASIAGAVVVPATVTLAQAAMATAMVGINVSGAAAVKITAGVTAWWGAVVTAYAVSTITVTPPTGLTTLAASLASTFADNIANNRNLVDATAALADTLHTGTKGGTFTVPPASPVTIV